MVSCSCSPCLPHHPLLVDSLAQCLNIVSHGWSPPLSARHQWPVFLLPCTWRELRVHHKCEEVIHHTLEPLMTGSICINLFLLSLGRNPPLNKTIFTECKFNMAGQEEHSEPKYWLKIIIMIYKAPWKAKYYERLSNNTSVLFAYILTAPPL